MKNRKQTKKTSSYHHGNLKESLVATALDTIDQEGLDGLTLRELSQKLGTSRSAVYRHFESKEALMQAVILAGFEQLDYTLNPIFIEKSKSFSERFEAIGRAYLDFAIQRPHLYRLLFGEKFRQEREEVCDINDETKATGFYALIGLLIEAQEEGIIACENPMLQAMSVWASIHGLALLLIDGHLLLSNDLEAIYTFSQGVLLRGLR